MSLSMHKENGNSRILSVENHTLYDSLPSKTRHELNNSLTVIIGNVQFAMITHTDLPEDVMLSLSRIEESAKHMRDLLFHSSMAAGA
jgi:signal transduction histidine kinase